MSNALLSTFLKDGTSQEHERLDRRIMTLAPFADRERYTLFVRTQTRLQRVASPLYQSERLARWLPGLAARDRLSAALSDCADLGVSVGALEDDRRAAEGVGAGDDYAALGWLYTVEGSNLGAAFLLKHAKSELGLSETFGARHLAGHDDGRGLHWRRFKEVLDALMLSHDERRQALQGALDAFGFAREGVEVLLAGAVVDVQ
ncbi:Heme oxygenase [Alloalcanivorax dieselolei B5]|uniref:Heme oxygenase n=1 Tax=Alcanivorax dieselolei (strain DSM 16502 / CGMCC 1.3690 / MCCC 1A00001 / B-5) TaxID=930169 RepID=K0CDK9_ALCDB|nr:biliverdin-producing heme oxygenase [Alloalcanivorax dieselolei]AFT69661.1 Heme oxygenase [Alloalcanivorax dieselolei B5]GGK03350.1 heme oxygenase [Alloalcanivorax dieselolei]